MVMSAEILGECAFSFLYIPHFLIRYEASTYDPRTVQPEGEPAGSPLRRRHPTRSPSARVQPWEKLRALHPHGLQAGGVRDGRAREPRICHKQHDVRVVVRKASVFGDLLPAPRIDHTEEGVGRPGRRCARVRDPGLIGDATTCSLRTNDGGMKILRVVTRWRGIG